ncbi:MAG: hypothetical protein KatS3mg102_0566 [Planctomycetota bacterium]|nr:MAG: hypothetical protein KatS3mg102_0566 [Planctomycetota bacterium]
MARPLRGPASVRPGLGAGGVLGAPAPRTPAAAGARRRAGCPPASASGLTLIEVLVALSILAFGMTAVLGLLAAASAVHRAATDRTDMALLADLAFARARAALTYGLRVAELPRYAGPAAGGRPVHALAEGVREPAYPDLSYDLLLTPIDAEDPAAADVFHVEARVRRLERGRERLTTFHTVMVRRLARRDLAVAGPP